MMTAVTAWLRLDLRRRWRSLTVLAVLIALAAATVMTAVAGAKRGASAVDRLVAETLPATVIVLPNRPGFDWEPVRALPEVEALSVLLLTAYEIHGLTPERTENDMTPADAEAMWTVEQPVVLDGRLADPSRADEAVVTPGFVSTHGKGVGDTVTIALFSPEAIDAGEFGLPDVADGPTVETTIVGVVRSPWFSDEVEGSEGQFVPSAGLFAGFGENLVGARNSVRTNALVRLHGGAASVPAFQAGLTEASGRSDIDVWDVEALFGQHQREVTGFEATSLLVFAVAAGIAAVFLVGQSIARYSVSTIIDLRVLRAVGMTPGQSRRAAMVGPTLAAALGTALGAVAAVVASRWFPIGTASLVEPAPGVSPDWPVLALGVVGGSIVVAAGAAGAASFSLRTNAGETSARRSVTARAAAGIGLPVPVVVGTRFALEPGRGGQTVPVRPALVGAITGVLGVLAALTFSSGVNDAASNPERFGRVHQLLAGLGFDDVMFTEAPSGEVLAALVDVPGIRSVNDARQAVAESDGVSVAVSSVDPIGVPLEFVVTEGRLPESAAEVVLGPGTAALLGTGVGDTVELTGTAGRGELAVVGISLMPEVFHNIYTTGALVTSDGYDRLFDGFRARVGLVALDPGVHPDEVLPGLYEALAAVPGGENVWLDVPAPPPELAELQQVRALPVVLAGFLAVLALGAVGHALATAVRRRRHDVAVLRALGMTRGQCRGVVVTQGTVLALAGLLVGVPVGVALGRTMWRYVAESWPLYYLSPVALLAVVLVVPVALVAANLLAAWPGHRAATLRVGQVLRAD
jgi:FtsX-like permease family